MTWRRVAAGWAGAAAVAGLLAACTVPPPPGGDGSSAEASNARNAAGSGNAGSGLRPLSRQPALPPGAAPRSQVPSVRYDLVTSSPDDLPPDDGVPGDAGPREIFERGGASWYGIQFHQRKTASGERFDMTAFTAAHKTLPFNTRLCVRSLVNGREVVVRVNDRGPYSAGRVIDLSRAAAEAIGMLGMGIKPVALSIVDKDHARCGGADIDVADVRDVQAEAKQDVPKRATRQVPARKRR